MSYKALYRRFRPTTFDGVVGQDHIITTLKNQVEKGQINHAYLFCGTRGTGKTSVAKIFAKAINCLTPQNGSPCGHCEVCQTLAGQNSMDILEIDAASNNRVDEIRDLREKVKYPPVNCKYKVYIIDEVHMLTESAFNALLKTLEEPPAHCVFILATTEPHKLPKTILSRCMRFDFRLIDNQTLENLICKIYDECKIEYDIDAIKQIVKAGNGSARDTISIADTCQSFINGKLTLVDVLNVLGANTFETMAEFVQTIIEIKPGDALQKLNEIYKSGKNLSVLATEITSYFRDLIAVAQNPQLSNILGIPEQYTPKLVEQAQKLTFTQEAYILSLFADIEMNLKYAINPLLNLEVATLKSIAYLTSPPTSVGGVKSTLNTMATSQSQAPQSTQTNSQSPPSDAPNTKLTQKIDIKRVWGKYLINLSDKNEMITYSACDDVQSVVIENDNVVISVTSLPSYNVLNSNETKTTMKEFFESFGVTQNIIVKRVEHINKQANTVVTLADELKEIIGDKLLVKN